MSNILSVKAKKGEATRHTGVQISRSAFSYLTLYALSEGTTRTLVIREMIEDWISNQPEEDLISKVVDKLQKKWRIQKANTPHIGNTTLLFEDFKTKLGEELKAKEIEESIIVKILNDLTNGKT